MTRAATFAAVVAAVCAGCGAPAPVTPSVNQPPVPVLEIADTATVGTPVHVDASKSNDLDGAVGQAFVLFGDGSDPVIVSNNPDFAGDHTYAAPGLYLVELYVLDDKGATARARVRLDVTP